MKEKEIEQKFVKMVKKAGGICPKFVSPGTDGMPDRIVLFPKGKIAFVEVKRSGGKPRSLQKAKHDQLRHLGFPVYVLDDAKQIPQIINQIGGDAK